MSRSYKRAILKYAPVRGKPGKQFANRKVRRTKNSLPTKGNHYRKLFNPWDIHDGISDMRFDYDDWQPRGAKKTRKGWMIPK